MRIWFCFEGEKKHNAGLGRDQREHLASPMTKSETSPSANTNESETSPRRQKNVSSPDSSTTALLTRDLLSGPLVQL